MKKHSFKYYRRGQIIQVNFEPQIGYEIKGVHYAIVITKRDQPFIGTLTVIPLTSKSGNHLLPIGSCISDSVFLELLNEKNLKASSNNLEYFKNVENKYRTIKKSSFANVHQITTIDKSKILNPLNYLDPIKRIRVSNEVMDKIDKEIITLFTNLNI